MMINTGSLLAQLPAQAAPAAPADLLSAPLNVPVQCDTRPSREWCSVSMLGWVRDPSGSAMRSAALFAACCTYRPTFIRIALRCT